MARTSSSVSSQENHKWTRLVLRGKGVPTGFWGAIVALDGFSCLCVFFFFFFFLSPWGKKAGEEEEGEIRGMFAWERALPVTILNVSTE